MKESLLNWASMGCFMMLVTALVVTQPWGELATAFLIEPPRFFLLEEVHSGDCQIVPIFERIYFRFGTFE